MKANPSLATVRPSKLSAAQVMCRCVGHLYFKGQCVTCYKPVEQKEEA